jgi:glycosyltransferase involved in cell wall biosynthesis
MSIGLCVRYQKHDATFAALSVAAHLKSRGIPFSIRACGWRARRVDPDWDQRIEAGHRHAHAWALDHKYDNQRKLWRSYQQWILRHKHIVWTEPPGEEELFFSLRHGRNNILWTSWDRIRPDDDWALNMVDTLIVPTETQRNFFRTRWKLKGVEVVPWDPLLPITQKPTMSRSCVKLFLSVYGSQLHRVGLGSVLSVSRILHTCPHVHATIACSKGLSALTKREFHVLQRSHSDRLRVIYDCPWHEQVLLMTQHDLTVWPSMVDGIGLVGLTSLYMGTPVFAFDIAPVNEVLTSGANAMLVSCKKELDWVGVPHVVPDNRRFEHALRELCKNTKLLRDLTSRTHATLEENRRSFTSGFNRLLPD